FPTAEVHLGSAEDHDPATTEGIWLDPARGGPGGGGRGRIHDPEHYRPPLSTVLDLARRLGRDGELGPLGVKPGPGIGRAARPIDAEVQWLALHGQGLEAVGWCGPLGTEDVSSSALVIDRDGAHRLDRRSETPGDADPGTIGEHLYEPD